MATRIESLQKKINHEYTRQIINYLISASLMNEEKSQTYYEHIFRILNLSPSSSISKEKKSRRKKNPDAPKRPPSAFFLFKKEKKQDIMDTLTDEGVLPTVKVIAKKAGELWRALSPEEKSPYVKQYEALKVIYEENKKIYLERASSGNNIDSSSSMCEPPKKKNKKVRKSRKIALDFSAIPPEFQDTWLGPFENTFLRGSPCRAKNTFNTLEEAIAAANERSDCAGVTLTKRGYTVRFGKKDKREHVQGTGLAGYEDLLYPSPIGEISYIKNDNAANAGDAETTKVVVEVLEPAKKKKKNMKTEKAVLLPAVVTTPYLDSESDSDSEDEDVVELPAKKITYKGTVYLKDNENKVYDYSSQEFVGKMIDGDIDFDAVESDYDSE